MNAFVDADHRRFARKFHALADPKRLGIVALLMRGERCVCDLADVVGAKQPLLSFHLKILREAKLVRNRRLGKWMYYSLNHESIEEIKTMIGAVAESREHLDDCRCDSVCCPAEPDAAESVRNKHE